MGPQNGKGVPLRSHQFLLNKFLDPSTPSMRKGNSGDKGKKTEKTEKTDENSGHHVIASSQPPERHRPNDDRTCQLWNPVLAVCYIFLLACSLQCSVQVATFLSELLFQFSCRELPIIYGLTSTSSSNTNIRNKILYTTVFNHNAFSQLLGTG